MPIMHAITDKVLFGHHLFAGPLQNVVQHILRGPRQTSFVFSDGPAQGMTFHCSTSDKSFFERHNFELPMRRTLERNVKPGWTVYNVGANTGLWVLPLSRLCGESGLVVAIEPSPANFARLSQNVAVNNLKNVHLLQVAASDSEGYSTIAEAGSMTSVGTGTIPVQLVPLDTINLPIPQLMVVDVEGHAPKVLQGAARILSSRPMVLLETHDQKEHDDVMSVLERFGYSCTPLIRATTFPRNFVAFA